MELGIGILIGAAVASLGWWIKVRGLQGVISDTKDVGSDVKGLKGKL